MSWVETLKAEKPQQAASREGNLTFAADFPDDTKQILLGKAAALRQMMEDFGIDAIHFAPLPDFDRDGVAGKGILFVNEKFDQAEDSNFKKLWAVKDAVKAETGLFIKMDSGPIREWER